MICPLYNFARKLTTGCVSSLCGWSHSVSRRHGVLVADAKVKDIEAVSMGIKILLMLGAFIVLAGLATLVMLVDHAMRAQALILRLHELPLL